MASWVMKPKAAMDQPMASRERQRQRDSQASSMYVSLCSAAKKPFSCKKSTWKDFTDTHFLQE